MLVPFSIDDLYRSNNLPSFIRKGWQKHYEKMNLSANKLSMVVSRRMKSGKIPPHLRGKRVKVICIDERPKRHYYVTLGQDTINPFPRGIKTNICNPLPFK